MEDFREYHFNSALRRKIEIVDLIIILILLGIIIFGLINYNYFMGEIRQEVENLGYIGLFLVSALLEFIPNFLNPYFGMMIAIAAGLNIHLVLLITCTGSLLGSFAGFELGYKWGFKFVAVLFKRSTLERLGRFIENHGRVFLILTALTPLPYLPIVFGAFQISRKEFWFYGILPRMLGLVVLGYGFYQGFSFF